MGVSGDIPPEREGHTISYVENTKLFYLFGGCNADEDGEFNDLYSFDPSSKVFKLGKGVHPGGLWPVPRASLNYQHCG